MVWNAQTCDSCLLIELPEVHILDTLATCSKRQPDTSLMNIYRAQQLNVASGKLKKTAQPLQEIHVPFLRLQPSTHHNCLEDLSVDCPQLARYQCFWHTHSTHTHTPITVETYRDIDKALRKRLAPSCFAPLINMNPTLSHLQLNSSARL